MRNYEKELNPILFSEFLNCFSVANIIDQNVNVNVNVNVKVLERFKGSGFRVQKLEGEEVHGFGRIRWG